MAVTGTKKSTLVKVPALGMVYSFLRDYKYLICNEERA